MASNFLFGFHLSGEALSNSKVLLINCNEFCKRKLDTLRVITTSDGCDNIISGVTIGFDCLWVMRLGYLFPVNVAFLVSVEIGHKVFSTDSSICDGCEDK